MQELAPQKKDGSYERPKYAFDKAILARKDAEFPVQTDDPEKASRGGWIFDGRDPVFGAKDLRGGPTPADVGLADPSAIQEESSCFHYKS
eukprot:jgi/Pico_ML_1/52842/g3490.t1